MAWTGREGASRAAESPRGKEGEEEAGPGPFWNQHEKGWERAWGPGRVSRADGRTGTGSRRMSVLGKITCNAAVGSLEGDREAGVTAGGQKARGAQPEPRLCR